MSRDAFDYTTLYILVLSILCTAIAAPIFANEYQTGSDSILRCTKYGRMKLAVTRILAASSIFIVIFVLGMSIHFVNPEPCVWHRLSGNFFPNVVFRHQPAGYEPGAAPDCFGTGWIDFSIGSHQLYIFPLCQM